MPSKLCHSLENIGKLSAWILTGAAGFLLAGCGDSIQSGSRPGLPTGVSSAPLVEDILLRVRDGADPAGLWADYDLIEAGALPDGSTYRALIGSGSTQTILNALESDVRVVDAEVNLVTASPVVRQTSIAFNEGYLSPGQFFASNLVERLHLLLAHTGSKGMGVKVAIIDTGVNRHHVVLERRITDDSYDFIDKDSDPQDAPDGVDNNLNGEIDEATGHGTQVAGLVALVAPASTIMSLRVLDSDGQGTAFNVAGAIEYAVNHGAKVINLSIRLSSPSTAVDAAIQYARDRGAILVTASGNSGYVQYPASDPRVWAVAALGAGNYPASFTSAFIGVVISAPGENILSTSWNGGYQAWSGTSMSAPIVAGAAALVVAIHPDWNNGQVLGALQESATGLLGNPETMGAGAVNPGAAVGVVTTTEFFNYERASDRRRNP